MSLPTKISQSNVDAGMMFGNVIIKEIDQAIIKFIKLSFYVMLIMENE